MPRAVFSDDDVEHYRDFDKSAANLIASGNYSEGMNALRQAHRLGTFEPSFVLETIGIKQYDLLVRIDEDHQNWLQAATNVFELSFVSDS